MSQFIEDLTKTLGIGIKELEIHFTHRPEIRSELGRLRETLCTTQHDYDSRDARVSGDDPEVALRIASVLRTGAETLDAAGARGARPILAQAERAIAADIRSRIAIKLDGIYVIVDPEATRGRSVTNVARQALEGGVKVVQLRDKLNDKGDILESARSLKAICDEYDALFVMNDHADVARAANAHALHVGQTDLPVPKARDILAPTQLIGNSNNGMSEAAESSDLGVDYLAVGAIYATATMGKSGRTALGPEEIARVRDAVSQPIVAIGGIDKTKIADVVNAGANSVCVVSAITFADDPETAARELVELYDNARSAIRDQ